MCSKVQTKLKHEGLQLQLSIHKGKALSVLVKRTKGVSSQGHGKQKADVFPKDNPERNMNFRAIHSVKLADKQ